MEDQNQAHPEFDYQHFTKKTQESGFIVQEIVDKILARLYQEKSQNLKHDIEIGISEEARNCIEPIPAPLDRQEINMMKFLPQMQELTEDKGEEIFPKPLIQNKQEDNDVIIRQRARKEREQQSKEEEIKRKQAYQKQLRDMELAEREQAKSLEKQTFTFNDKGEVLLIKDPKSEYMPKTLVDFPYKIKDVKTKKKPQEPILNEKVNFKNIQLLTQIEVPPLMIKSEDTPMGSAFEKTNANEGVIVTEQGKSKYGEEFSSKRGDKPMTIDKYHQQKSQALLYMDQSLKERTNNNRSTMVKNNSLKILAEEKQISMNSLFQTNPLNFNNSKHLESYNNMTSSQNGGFMSQRNSIDKVFQKKRESLEQLLTERGKQNIYEGGNLERSSYIESLIIPKSSIQQRKIKQQKNDFSQDNEQSNAQNFSKTGLNFLKSLPVSRAGSIHNYSEQNLELFNQKNQTILRDKNWGSLNHRKQISSIIKKPPKIDVHRTQSSFLNNRKERHFIETIKNKQHLPPPPLGRSIGHGNITERVQTSNYLNSLKLL